MRTGIVRIGNSKGISLGPDIELDEEECDGN